MFLYLISFAILSFVAGWLIYPILIKWNVIDNPNSRSSHSKPIVRGGGLGFVSLIIFFWLCYFIWIEDLHICVLLLAAAFLALISFIDDVCSLPAGIRFGCQALSVAVAIWFLYGISRLQMAEVHGNSLEVEIIIGIFLFLWIAGYTNAFNFMDGINGLVSMQGIITCFGVVLILMVNKFTLNSTPILILLSIGGACLGFMPHNFPIAKMFMGDVGSITIGYLLAVLMVWIALESDKELLIPFLLLQMNFILDTGITLFLRILRGEPWYMAHNKHFYQKLFKAGKSHSQITITENIIQIIIILLILFFPSYSVPMQILVFISVVGAWFSFFLYAQKAFDCCSNEVSKK
jgi:UDP-N-acetylmuramyl pentapeptide phosphotransferase/UDP-N-acetylglucosamine-1-phosphate transferase